MRVSFDKRWLLPLGILTTSALVALGVIIFDPSSASRSSADCSGASASDYTCYQNRYQSLVHDSGVEAAFAKLKDEYKKNDFVRSSCHQLVHVIGRTALERYGDLPATFSHGDDFCGSGYYHGVMESVVAKIGADRILEEANTLCADLSERQKHSFYHRTCVHGLGHGFMAAYNNELFEALKACEALTDGWEKEHCYGGVFMENTVARNDPSHPSKYLKADQPLYPCTEVEARYKNQCYYTQASNAPLTQGNDFAKVFDLCRGVEDDFRPTCYEGMGAYASLDSIEQNTTDAGQTGAANMLCMLGEDYEARSNCVLGAVKEFIKYYHSDKSAKTLCKSLEADLRAACLRAGEEYYEMFQTRLE